MALADLAFEMMYGITVLTHLGHEFDHIHGASIETSKPDAHKAIHKAMGMIHHGVVKVSTDSQSAHDIVNSETVTANSRHIERKVLKMKELRVRGIVKVVLVPTAENEADLLTKVLDTKTFLRHRAAIMNSKAAVRGA